MPWKYFEIPLPDGFSSSLTLRGMKAGSLSS